MSGTLSFQPHWMARVPRQGLGELADLRTSTDLWVGGIEVADGAAVWFTGEGAFHELTPELRGRLRSVAEVEVFRVDQSGRDLIPMDKLVPTNVLPEVTWSPFGAVLKVVVPPAELISGRAKRARLTLVHAEHIDEPTGLVTSWEVWSAYALTAPKLRLDRLEFAVSADDRVFVVGTPLPPIPGIRLVNHQGLYIPAGWTWSPALEPSLLRKLLNLEENERGLCLEGTDWQRISADSFVTARRENIRGTQRILHTG